MSVVLETTLGALTVDLFVEARPKVCLNFLKLCRTKFYNFCPFHNVQPGFLAQTGDPQGTGRGGQSVFMDLYGPQARFFEGEFLPKIRHSAQGLLSMVSVGEGMLGSQFFLTLDDQGLETLDQEHCVFGQVVEGLDVLDRLNAVITDTEHRPYQDVRLTHTVVLEDPFDDPPGLIVPAVSPEPGPEVLGSDRLAADEELSDEDDLSEREKEERAAEREAKAQATILEMIGDLPEADCAPPENVLFVCKLNPVTTDEDLETLFSRFGRVVSCEVIRDRKTNDSLQYAFVEFENPQACEQAYFKMDNVLIDDRRIHVDFSQSVSKYQWKGKGRLTIRSDEKPPPKSRRSPSPRSRSKKSTSRRRSRSRSRDKRRRNRSRSRDTKKRPRSRSRSRGRDRSEREPHRHSHHRRPKSRSRSRERRRSKERRRR